MASHKDLSLALFSSLFTPLPCLQSSNPTLLSIISMQMIPNFKTVPPLKTYRPSWPAHLSVTLTLKTGWQTINLSSMMIRQRLFWSAHVKNFLNFLLFLSSYAMQPFQFLSLQKIWEFTLTPPSPCKTLFPKQPNHVTIIFVALV